MGIEFVVFALPAAHEMSGDMGWKDVVDEGFVSTTHVRGTLPLFLYFRSPEEQNPCHLLHLKGVEFILEVRFEWAVYLRVSPEKRVRGLPSRAERKGSIYLW